LGLHRRYGVLFRFLLESLLIRALLVSCYYDGVACEHIPRILGSGERKRASKRGSSKNTSIIPPPNHTVLLMNRRKPRTFTTAHPLGFKIHIDMLEVGQSFFGDVENFICFQNMSGQDACILIFVLPKALGHM
jgi:hypothetical protein